MARSEQSVLTWIIEMGEARVLQFVEELLSNPQLVPKITEAISMTLQGAVRTRGQVDRNVQAMLALLGVPTKADYNKLLSKIEALQGSLVNLNIKLDRLVAAREMPVRRAAARRGAKRRGTTPGTARGRERPSDHGVGKHDKPR